MKINNLIPCHRVNDCTIFFIPLRKLSLISSQSDFPPDFFISTLNCMRFRRRIYFLSLVVSLSCSEYLCLKMAGNKFALYNYFRSSCSWRVRIALAFKGVDYEYKAVNLLKGEQLSEDFKKINPSGFVPALLHNSKVVTHSTAILEYLEEVIPTPALLPKDPVLKAKVRAIVDTIAADIQPIQNKRILKYVGEKHLDWGKHWIEEGFKAVELFLQETHGQYCVGDNVTLADVYLVPQVFNCSRFNVDVKQFPLINEISSRLLEIPSFKISHPLVQPDCPDELRKQ